MTSPVQQTVFVAGHAGMVGSAIVRRLQSTDGTRVLTADRKTLDLTRQREVEQFFGDHRIDHVVLAAARVGGIHANSAYPVDFLVDNLLIETNVIRAAHEAGVARLLFLGSSCIYPRDAAQPLREESLLTGPLEPTNEPYAIAKIAGIKMCEAFTRQYGRDYRSVMPTNLYGPGDNFHPENAHVIPALMRRFHEAVASGREEVRIWGSGNPRREFLHVDDMADASVFLMNLSADAFASRPAAGPTHVNIGAGVDCSIRELAERIARVTGFTGRLEFDPTRPDGTPRKLMDVSRLHALGWRARIGLEDGLVSTYRWFREQETVRG